MRSTWYIADLPPDHAFAVVRIVPLRAGRGNQPSELRVVGPLQPDCVVRAQPGREQLETSTGQLSDAWQIDRSEGREPGRQQLIYGRIEGGEHQHPQQRLSVERPRPRRSLRMSSQLPHV